MKVLFQIRSDYKKCIAGDSIQMLKTKEYLTKLGIDVEISSDYNKDLKKYDILHLFNLVRANETYQYHQNALKQNKPYVLSTIYWNMTDYIKNDLNTKSTLEWWFKSNNTRKEIIKNAAVLLPNSDMEMQVLQEDFNISNKYFVIPNCSDRGFYFANPEKFIKKYKLKDFVLCVGRISNRKNQLALINSLKNQKIKLVLIGPRSNQKYYEICKEASSENVIFFNEMKHYELSSAYAAAKVHVLPSWFETPGLSTLEAGLAGCNIVSTDKGSTKEYFQDFVHYCDPNNEKSIGEAVLKAYIRPKNNELKNYILNNYTWEVAASKTLEAYQYLIDHQR